MRSGLIARLRERGLSQVAASYAVIAWLVLQIADLVLGPWALPRLPKTFRRRGLAWPLESPVP